MMKLLAADLQHVRDLALQIWPAHYTPIIGEQQVTYMLDKLYSLPALQKQQSEGQQFFEIYSENNLIGFVAVSLTDPGEWFLNKLYILPQFQGQGLGEKTMLALEAELGDWKAIRLQVNRQNYKSVNFYFKTGFHIASVGDFDIGDGFYMNDFIMLKTR